ncbi:cupin domain-containing protein [Maribellus maritimus]|uniref:hypothetical protein n=1 Tax=Maribellus maritimus TaxID=2870838 RepID=UPI001EE9E8D0|nr:hypothetical protein [Maribellus maritimus]MCG6191532.1 hypothetical protein [Maribellus maritimus]
MTEIAEYASDSVMSKTIIRKPTGNVRVMAFDTGKILPEIILPFDIFIQIIEGDAEIVINKHSNLLKTGEVVVIPAHTSYYIKASKRLK